MTIQENKRGAVTVLKPVGPLTLADADQFKAKLLEVRQACMGRLVIDASAISYVDSIGLETLLEMNEGLAQIGQSLKLCGLNETFRQVLDLTGISSQFEQFEDVTSAVRSFI